MKYNCKNARLSKKKNKTARGTFLIDRNFEVGEMTHIAGTDSKHIRKVLRLCKGDEIKLFDNLGNNYKGIIEKTDTANIEIIITEKHPIPDDPKIKVILCQSIPKLPKMDLIIQKSVEIGVTTIVPLLTERTLIKTLDHPSLGAKFKRWNKMAYEAVKQCGRANLPTIEKPCYLDDFFKIIDNNHQSEITSENGCNEFPIAGSFRYILSTDNNDNLFSKFFELYRYSKDRMFPLNTKSDPIRAYMLVGPEGGFTEKEKKMARENGFVPVKISSNILRVETAAILGVGLILNYLDYITQTIVTAKEL
jgi:16S rRNA (uracil1498-N3)-methyltransferase